MSKSKRKVTITVPDGDPVNGKQIFEGQCSTCHAIQGGDDKNAAAPSLGGVFGRDAGMGTSFPYSNAMKKCKIKWTDVNLFLYIKAPGKFIPGNKMSYSGLPDDQERADLIAFLKSVS